MSNLRGPRYSFMEMLRHGDIAFGIVDMFIVTEPGTWAKPPKERVSLEMRGERGHNPKD